MGRDAFLVDYASSGIPRNEELFKHFEKHMPKAEDTGHFIIDDDTLDEDVLEHTEFWAELPDVLQHIRTLLSAKGGTIELYIG